MFLQKTPGSRKRIRTRKLFFLVFVISFSGCTTIIDSTLSADSSQNILEIAFSPEGSQVFIDGILSGTTPMELNLRPGQMVSIEITQEGYIPYTETISMPPSGHLLLQGALAPLVITSPLLQRGTYPSFMDEKICFITLSEPYRLMCGQDGEFVERVAFSSYPEHLITSSYGLVWSQISEERNSIQFLPVSASEPTEIIQGEFCLAVQNDGKKFLMLGLPVNGSGNLQLFEMSMDGNISELYFNKTPQGRSPDGVTLSANDEWLVTQSSGIVELWHRENGQFVYVKTLETYTAFAFSPTLFTNLGFMDAQNSLGVIDLATGEKTMFSDNVLAFTWLPNGDEILFSKMTTEGSSLFKLMELNTGLEKIIADPSNVLGFISDFAISQDGLMIVYANRFGRIQTVSSK